MSLTEPSGGRPQASGNLDSPDDRYDPVKAAQKVCETWAESKVKILEDRKITVRSIANDFEVMAKEISVDRIRTFVAEQGTKSADKDDPQELMIAIWVAWRVHDVKGGLKGVLSDLDKFVKVRFKTDPSAATISINGLAQGKSPKHLYLSRERF